MSETNINSTPSLRGSMTNDDSPDKPNQTARASPVGTVLTEGRRLLWKGNPPPVFSIFLNPLRTYVFDPILAVNSVLLPVILPYMIDNALAKALKLGAPLIMLFYGWTKAEDLEVTGTAKSAIMHQPTAVMIHKPSDMQSAFTGIVSFVTSAIGDVAGVLTNPKKYQGWIQALSQFNAFLSSTGVGDDMIEAIQKPLLCGRLMDNFKILNDIQEIHHSDRIQETTRDKSNDDTFADDIKQGHRLMRFATAAYGTEMIRSALDKEMDGSKFVDGPVHAMAHHTGLDENDIKIVYSGNDKDFNDHTLHHFVSLYHDQKAVVLAIRGTLSLSGAIVDIQGMPIDFCGGHAHKGITEMANNLWKESADKVTALMEEYSDYKLIVTGHSLGAGTSCLLTVKLYSEGIFKDRVVKCYAFAPPPTYFPKVANAPPDAVKKAMENTVAYINDNDVVPFLSVCAVRRMVNLLDAVDNQTEHIWFWKRWKIFYGYNAIPEGLIKNVLDAEKSMCTKTKSAGDESALPLFIPARSVVWIKQISAGKCEASDCDPEKIAAGNIFLCPDMLSDHMPEQYENALDSILDSGQT